MTSLGTCESSSSATASRSSHVGLAQAEMHASPYRSLRNIVCECRGNQLVLRGHVESYHLKQLAQETVRRQSTGQIIVNLLTVD